MSQIAIKFMANAALAFRLRQAALARGTCVADIVRRACESHVDVAPHFGDALVESHHDCEGNKVVGAWLSPPLASAIAKLAQETKSSQSRVLRGLIREALRARQLLHGAASAEAAEATSGHTDAA